MAKVKKYGIVSTLTVENRKMTIWSKFATCNRGINIEHKQLLKKIV